MHTLRTGECIVYHNGDFSGEIEILNLRTQQVLNVPFEDIKHVVATYVRNERISALEQASDDKLLLSKL